MTAASALTVVDDGDVVSVGPGLESTFIGDIKGRPNGGMGSWTVEFDSSVAAMGSALVTLSQAVADTFSDLTIAWRNAADNSVFASRPIIPIDTTLMTNFMDPSLLNHLLVISWSGSSTDPRVGFDVTVDITPTSPVPLPAAALLLLTGVGGLGALRARRGAAA